MRKFSFLFLSIFSSLCFFSSQAINAAEVKLDLPEEIKIKPNMYGHFVAGQIANGSLKVDDVTFLEFPQGQYKIGHIWHENAVVEGGMDVLYNERLKLTANLGAKLYFSYPILKGAMYTKNLRQDVYVADLFAEYRWGEIARPWLLAEVGYFPFKYNTDAKNFGDYLFRTGTYPIWFDMNFDTPWQRLLGVHAQTNLFRSLKIDLLLASSTVAPAMDWSVAGLVDYDVARLHFVNIGAGVDFANLMSVYTENSFPAFGGDPTTPSSDNMGMRYLSNMRVNGTDTSYDTSWYTFKGTKVMGRISLNPMVFLPQEINGWKVFGKDDWRLYAEADIIGVKSYPDTVLTAGNEKQMRAPSYNKLLEKMPVAIGINLWSDPVFTYGIAPEILLAVLEDRYNWKTQLPTTVGCLLSGVALSYLEKKFNWNTRLDVLNFELEWFGARYYNDASNVINKYMTPLPYNVQYWGSSESPKKNFYKWSVYAKKSFWNGHFALTAQVGRDHLRLPCADYQNELWNELLVEENDWAWYLKTSWMF
jgi:hypothetical protein